MKFTSPSIKPECNSFVCFDLETTDLSIHKAEIIEIGAVKVNNWKQVEVFQTFVKPDEPLTDEIIELTGISEEDVENAPSISEALPLFLNFIEGEVLLGHNIEHYDLPILRRIASSKYISINNKCIDTLSISRKFLTDIDSHCLDALCSYYSIKNEDQHRALSDCLATAKVYKCMICGSKGNKEAANRKKKEVIFRKSFSEQTQSLITLNGIITGITCDNILTESEVFFLRDWLNQHESLNSKYPFSVIFREVNNALSDGVLEQHELDNMLEVFKEFLNPVEVVSNNDETIDFRDKTVCLTGDFITGSKDDIGERLKKIGASISKSVIKRVDYLIVGEKGSDAWSCGNYGNKIKIALEMQNKGHHIKILKECDVFSEDE